jgi:hypothetical protein
MIHYQLQCSHDHGFDGWFPSSASFESQARRGLLECPTCGDTRIDRALMAPNLPKKANAKTATPPAKTISSTNMPAEIRAALQRLRTEVETNCEHVGTRFADEARAIHNGETPARGIYGETTPEQAEALAEDGIEIARIPWVPPADA